MTDHDIDHRDVVEHFWPYDKPNAEDVVTAAGALPDIVRYLNNATQPDKAQRTLPFANSIDTIISSLKSSVYGLDQLVEQLSTAARAQAARPDVYDARAENPKERHTEGTQQALELAEKLSELRSRLVVWDGFRAVGGLAVELESVHSTSARIGNDPDLSD